jgi:hypothetical protein
MWTLVSVKKSDDTVHKYVALFRDGNKTKKTYFGAVGYSDYTIHKDKARRERYRIRHKKDLRTKDPTRAGYLSYYLLWGDSTSLFTNLRLYKKKFFA